MDLIVQLSDTPDSDKVVLPSHVLLTILDTYGESLPHPLIFKIKFGEVFTFVGVKQFTADSQTIQVPQIILSRLNAAPDNVVTVTVADNIPKGTSLQLKPLQFYPEIHNWKYYLESHLTKHYTALSKNDIILINGYELAVQDLSSPTVSIIDTDLVLDIVPLNDIMAQQQLNFNVDNSEKIEFETQNLTLKPFSDAAAKIRVFKLDILHVSTDIIISLSSQDLYNSDIIVGGDRLITLENFKFTTMDQDFECQQTGKSKSVTVPYEYIRALKDSSEQDMLQGFDIDEVNHWLYIVPFAWEHDDEVSVQVQRIVEQEKLGEVEKEDNTLLDPICSNCNKPIPSAQFQLHQIFCVKNNVKCPLCKTVFLKTIPETHWHCPSCEQYSDSSIFRLKHSKLHHQLFKCDKCEDSDTYPSLVSLIVQHKSSTCPFKLHECKFCHLVLEQEAATYIDNFENLTHHENNCGNKTDECFKCQKLIKRKDFRKHFKLHQLDNQQATETFMQVFKKCTNENCVNEASSDNLMDLCNVCYGPLYSQLHDPNNQKLQARLERRYVLQLNKGCDNQGCQNQECKRNTNTGSLKDIIKRAQELMGYVVTPSLPINKGEQTGHNRFWLCVNDGMTEKMNLYRELGGGVKVLQALNNVSGREAVVQWIEEHS